MPIVPLSMATLPAALELLATQLDEHGISLPRPVLEAAVQGILDVPARGAILVALEPEPAGVASLSFTWALEHGGPIAWLEELYVLPARRGAGLGQALLDEAMRVARRAGCLAIDLEVDAEHRRVESLYARNGFIALPRARFARRLG